MAIAPTTVKLPTRLKRRVGVLARAAGQTTHAWLVEAIEGAAEREEEERAFVKRAMQSKREVDEGAGVYELEDVVRWMRDRVAGKRTRKPVARKR